jgi:hypothetical protein
MEEKMKKVFVMFTVGLPLITEAMPPQGLRIENESLVYEQFSNGHNNEVSCYPRIEKSITGRFSREFASCTLPRNNVDIDGVVFSVTSMVNPAIKNVEKDYTLESTCIPASVQLLDKCCFYSCNGLKEVAFEQDSQLQRIGRSAFSWCQSLEFMTIPESVQFLDEECFAFCKNLMGVMFRPGSNLERIGEYAFDVCPALESIIVPASMDITPLRNYFGTKSDDLIHVVND